MRWVPALLGLCVIGGLGVTWLLDPGPAAPPPAGRSPVGDGPADQPDVGPGTATGDLAAATDPGAVPASEQGDLLRQDGALANQDAGGPSIRVVRGDPPAPVARAEVFFLSEPDLDRRNRERETNLTRWEGPELFGQRAWTDERGEVQLPAGGRGRWFCSAQKDGEFGFVAAQARPRMLTLQLQPDEQVLLAARYGDRRPASVPVAVVKQRSDDSSDTIWRGHTNVRGKVLVRHFQLVRGAASTDPARAAIERFAAVALLPTNPLCLAEFAGRPTTSATVELVVPPLGSIQVHLVDHGGQPLLSPAVVGFGTDRIKRPDGAIPLRRGLLSQRANKPVGDQPVTLPFVQADREVQLYARYPDDRRAARSEQLKIPRDSDGPTPATIKPLPRHCVLAGRLLTPERRGVDANDIAVTIWRDDRVQQTATIRTVPDGRWDLVLTGRTETVRWRMELRYREHGAGDTPARWLGASLALPAWPPGQRVALGDIVLAPLPPLIAGVVVDDLGQPVPGATVTVQQEREQTKQPARPTQLTPGPRGLVVNYFRNSRPRDPWRSLPQLRTRADSEGRFQLDGAMPPGKLRVRADSNKHFAVSIALPSPNQNLRIQLDRNGIVRGRVLLPDWIARNAVTLTMRPFEESRRKTDTRKARVSGRGGSTTIEPLRPGRYDLIVTMRNLKQPLATVPDVFVTPGETREPRLLPIDLGQALFRYRLRALDQSAVAMALDTPIHARLQRTDGTWEAAGFRWQKGKAELITAHPMAELTFFGRGFEPLRQRLSPGDHDIYLRALRPALVNVPGARGLSGPTRKVRVSVILKGDTGYPSSLSGTDQRTGRSFSFPRWDLGRSSGGWLEDSDVVSIPLMKAGRYEVLLRPHASESTSTPQASVSLGEYELKPDGVTMVTVNVDAQAVTEALARIDEQHKQRLERRKRRSRNR